VHFAAYDGNGNLTAMVSSTAGSLSGIYEYEPFGNRTRATGAAAISNPVGFSAQCRDDVVGSLKYLFRDQSLSLGRWDRRDHIGEHGGPNLHCFTGNNPVSAVDVFGLSFKVIRKTAAPGTIDLNDPSVFGQTRLTKFQHLDFTVTDEVVTCAYCQTIHVVRDYEQEVTTITPTVAPPGYSQNGFNMIVNHERERVEVYSRAYYAYLDKVKGAIDGKYLCCSEVIWASTMDNWALAVINAYEDVYRDYTDSELALITNEDLEANYIRDANGLVDGTKYIYTPSPMPGVGPLPGLPGCR